MNNIERLLKEFSTKDMKTPAQADWDKIDKLDVKKKCKCGKDKKDCKCKNGSCDGKCDCK